MNHQVEKKLSKLLINTGDMALKRRARKIVEELDPKNGDQILDVGCGDGYYSYLLDNLGLKLKIVATDFDEDGLRKSRKNLDKSIKVVKGDLMKKLPFKDNSFNKVVMSEVAEHLPNDVKGLKEVYRVMKKGGTLCLTVPDANYPFFWDPVNWILDRTTGEHIKSGFWAGIWNQHIRLYKRSEIVKVIEKAGFKVEKSTAVTFWSLPFNHHVINLVARLLYGGKLSPEIASSVNKYQQKPKRPFVLNLAFGSVNFLDKLNNVYQSREIGVSIFVKAIK